MAGSGRRSHYRKHLTDAVLHDLPEPDETIGQRIARIIGSRGGNMFDVIVAPISGSKDKVVVQQKDGNDATISSENANEKNKTNKEEIILQSSTTRTAAPTTQLAFLPTKFRKLVWIKRNDYVIVECGDEEEDNKDEDTIQDQSSNKKSGKSGNTGFRYVITHILYKEQVKHIKSKGLWPSDPLFAEEGTTPDDVEDEADTGEDKDGEEPQNDTYYEDDDGIVFDDDDLMVNTNRIATLRVEDSSSDEDSD